MGTGRKSLCPDNRKNSQLSVQTRRLKAAAVIAAGGTGTRMNSGIPKQFLELAGKPILLHTVACIASLDEINQIIIALPSEHVPAARRMLSTVRVGASVECVSGGSNRQESVRCGVACVDREAEVIMVHDAVRPLCDRDMMIRVLNAALEKGAAVPGLPATDTIQRVSRTGRVLATPPRRELFTIQTPQAFHADLLKSALDRARAEGFVGTDESSVVRRAGHRVTVVPGSPNNIKITRPLDLDIAELLISRRSREGGFADMNGSTLRIGQGVDYHRLTEGRRLILGGVEIPFEKGLEGHSDADVLSHAVCDALLGAAAIGDIGRHFPDTDPSNLGRNSLEFLCEVRAMVETAGWNICNIDTTLLVQRPKLAPHLDDMKKNIAASLGLEPEDVNIKATTTEGMNAEGRGEGISAQAVALLYRK
jgi:2-C-methyl-D-erythritol 4-phosphate cytidylyltransferase/2-C-methyl-D-erythritol 2,4-cyclodiphosphate synthase